MHHYCLISRACLQAGRNLGQEMCKTAEKVWEWGNPKPAGSASHREKSISLNSQEQLWAHISSDPSTKLPWPLSAAEVPLWGSQCKERGLGRHRHESEAVSTLSQDLWSLGCVGSVWISRADGPKEGASRSQVHAWHLSLQGSRQFSGWTYWTS